MTSRMLISIVTPLLLSVAIPTFAQNPNTFKLTVVQDSGGVSAMPYYEELGLIAEPLNTPVLAQPNLFAGLENMLPVKSALMTPGPVTARAIQAPNLTPIFIVGDDDLSRRWLLERKESLQQMGAIGLVVQVDCLERLQALQNLVPDLRLSPVSGDDMAQRLNLAHYPVLITSTRIEQ